MYVWNLNWYLLVSHAVLVDDDDDDDDDDDANSDVFIND